MTAEVDRYTWQPDDVGWADDLLDGAEKRFNPAELRGTHGRWSGGSESEAQPEITKTGPHGYSHGWIKDTDASAGSLSNAEAFKADQGFTGEMTDSNENVVHALLDNIEKRIRGETRKQAWRDDKGVQFTRFSLEREGMPGERVFIAQTQPGGKQPYLAGAARVHIQDNALHVDYIGTTGITRGTGTALAKQIAKYAAEQGLPVTGEPENEGAMMFWQKIGWHHDPTQEGFEVDGWTADEAKRFASA